MRLTALNSTNSMSTEARGETAVMTETRFAALPISRRASGVERRHQFALGQQHEIAPVDDVVAMAFEPCAAARQVRHPARQRQNIADDELALVAVVACDRARRALARGVDGGEPREAGEFANEDREQSETGNAGENRAAKYPSDCE